jgi:hypothetical protein
MAEVWKQIADFPKYSISSNGRVKNKKGLLLKLSPRRKGYVFVALYDNEGNSKTRAVHRLVALAFIPNPENKPQVDHINRNKSDNKVTNLRWATCSENNKNKGKLKNPPRSKRVIQFSLSGEYIEEWESAATASRKLHIDHSGILRACTGKRGTKTCGKFKWKFSPDVKIEGEIWKTTCIEGETVEVSDKGRIKINGCIRKQQPNCGYYYITIKKITKAVHRIVCSVTKVILMLII